MAINATTAWEVRPTNGTANAGGGFDASNVSVGTDYSQQNAVQIAFTDLVIGNPTTTQLTSAANPFGVLHPGNVIAITGGTGFTVGLYQVVSVSGSTATMDRSVGTAGSTGGTGNLGGARSGFSNGTTALQGVLVAGNKVWVKNEAWNEAVALSVAGTATAPIVTEGYNSTRGDTPTGTNRPTNNRASAAGVGIAVSGARNAVKNIVVSNSGGNGWNTTGAACVLFNCRATAAGTNGFNGNATCAYIACEADNCTQIGFNPSAVTTLFACNARNNTTNGMEIAGTNTRIFFCIIAANSSHGLSASNGVITLINCTINGNSGAGVDGINVTTPDIGSIFYNNIITNNGRFGANGAATATHDGNLVNYNNYFGNGTGARDDFTIGANDQAINPIFPDAANGNFSIVAALKALGFPGLFPTGTSSSSTGYLDMGAVQRQEPAPKLINAGLVN